MNKCHLYNYIECFSTNLKRASATIICERNGVQHANWRFFLKNLVGCIKCKKKFDENL